MVDSDAESLVRLFTMLWSKSDLGRCAESILWRERMQAGGLQGQVCRLRTMAGLVSVSGSRTGNRQYIPHPRLVSVPRVGGESAAWGGGGRSRLARMLRVIWCFELSFQHCYLPYRWEEAGNGLPGLSKTLGKAAKLEAYRRNKRLPSGGGSKASVLSSTGK